MTDTPAADASRRQPEPVVVNWRRRADVAVIAAAAVTALATPWAIAAAVAFLTPPWLEAGIMTVVVFDAAVMLGVPFYFQDLRKKVPAALDDDNDGDEQS